MWTQCRSTGQSGTDACIRCLSESSGVRQELPSNATRKGREKTYGGPTYVAEMRGNLGIAYVKTVLHLRNGWRGRTDGYASCSSHPQTLPQTGTGGVQSPLTEIEPQANSR